MKKEKIYFIKKSLLFIFVLAVIIFILNFIWINFVEKNKNVIKQEDYYHSYTNELKDKKIEYAFFGDSHTRDAINIKYIENSFNFGIPSENYIEIYFRLKKILEEDRVLIKNVVLEIDSHIFSDKRAKEHLLFRNTVFYSEFVSLLEIAEFQEVSFPTVLIQRYFPVFGNGEELIKYFLQQSKKLEVSSKINSNNTKEANFDRISGFFDKDVNINNQVFDYFIKTIQLVEKNKINVVFIKYPLSKEYDEIMIDIGIKDIIENNYYTNILKGIKNELGENYILFDYYNEFFNHSEYFSDSEHLNVEGAEVFSKIINKDFSNLNYQ